jgi:hypothetical protein
MDLLNPFEPEAVLFLAQPASERHALTGERNDPSSNLNLPGNDFTQPSCDGGVAVLFPGVEHAAETHSAILVQPFNFGLAQ